MVYRLLRKLTGRKPGYRPGDFYKYYSQLNWNLSAGRLAYQV